MTRTPDHHRSYFKTRGEKIKDLSPQEPRFLVLWSTVLNAGAILQVTLLTPVIAADLRADIRTPPRQKRTLVTPEREKENQQKRRWVCANTIVSSTPR